MAVRGTSATQDGRYLAQEKKLLAQMTFPACFEQRVDMRKVQREVINQWLAERLTQLLGFEDDIVVALAVNLLEPKVDERLDPRRLQVALTGFLEKQAAAFTEELWQLLLSAQSSPTGIPAVILEKKKKEMEAIAQDKQQLKKLLDVKRAEVQGRDGKPEDKAENRRSRSLQRRPRSPPRRAPSPRRRSPSVRRRSRSPPRRRRSPSPRRRLLSPRRRSRSSPRGRSRRDRSRSPSVKRRRSYRSPSRSREQRSERRERSPRRRSRSRRSRRSPSSSSSVSRGRSPSSSRSPSPRRRSTKSRRQSSAASGSDRD